MIEKNKYLFIEIFISFTGLIVIPIIYNNLSLINLNEYFLFLLINLVSYSILAPIFLDPLYRNHSIPSIQIKPFYLILVILFLIVSNCLALAGIIMALRNIKWNIHLFNSLRSENNKIYKYWILSQLTTKGLIIVSAIIFKLNPLWAMLLVNELVFNLLIKEKKTIHSNKFNINQLKSINWHDWVYRIIFNIQELILSLSLGMNYSIYKLSAIENPIYNLVGAYLFRKNIKKKVTILIFSASIVVLSILSFNKEIVTNFLNLILGKEIVIDILIIYWFLSSVKILYPIEKFTTQSTKSKLYILLLTIIGLVFSILAHWFVLLLIFTIPFIYDTRKPTPR